MDFTEVSLNGFRYAYDRFGQSNITVLHAITGILDPKGHLYSRPDKTKEDLAHAHLKKSICEHLELDEVPSNVQIEAYYGEPVRVITNYLKDHAFDAVVIGSRDKYDLFDKIFGTISLGIIKKNVEPIFVIPRFGVFKKYSKIMVATDQELEDQDVLMQIDYWNTSNANVKFLHVSEKEDKKEESFAKAKSTVVEHLYESYQPSFSFEIESVQSSDISDSILANAYNYGADLLIVISKPSSYLKTLVFKSMTKELLLKSDIPMLFLHHSKKTES